jgi:hypothetical protein
VSLTRRFALFLLLLLFAILADNVADVSLIPISALLLLMSLLLLLSFFFFVVSLTPRFALFLLLLLFVLNAK